MKIAKLILFIAGFLLFNNTFSMQKTAEEKQLATLFNSIAMGAIPYLAVTENPDAMAIIKSNPKIINAKNEHSTTPLMVAAAHNNEFIFHELLQYQDLLFDAQDQNGRTALFYAVIAGNPSSVQALVNAGANTIIVDSQGKNASRYINQSPASAQVKQEIRRILNTPSEKYLPTN